MSLNFEIISTRDADCRCCGTGTKEVCDRCLADIKGGKAFFLEVILQGKANYRFFTRYVVAIQANLAYENGSVEKTPMTPGIYLITQDSLKTFMKDEYRIGFTGKEHVPKFLEHAPGLNRSGGKATNSSRSVVELPHTRH